MSNQIFVVGTPRSGTSLTADILNNHSNVLCGGELHYYDSKLSKGPWPKTKIDDLMHLYAKFSQFEDQKRIENNFPEIKNSLLFTSRAELLESFMKSQAILENCSIWGNSVPRDIFNWREIKNDFPEAKFIVCIRNPFDFMASYKNRYKTTYAKNKERLKQIYHPVSTIILWCATQRMIKKLNKTCGQDVFLVRYEDLVTEPAKLFDNICNWLDIRFEKTMLDTKFSNSSHQSASKGIYSTSIGGGLRALSKREQATVHFFAGMIKSSYKKEINFSFANFLNTLPLFPSLIRQLFFLARLSKDNGRSKGFFHYILRRFL